MKKGIIVSIQKYSKTTTQELARNAIEGGAVGIRTDQPIKCKVPIIGLLKIPGKEYYITTDKEAILQVSKFTNLIAIDSRKGNRDIDLLYSVCHVNNLEIVADIEKIEDVENILKICNSQRIIRPKYIATTFSNCNIDLIREIVNLTNIPIIAEGGYDSFDKINKAKDAGAYAVCIGTAISDIKKITEGYISYWNNYVA